MTAPAYVGTGPAIWDPGTQWAPSLTVTAADVPSGASYDDTLVLTVMAWYRADLTASSASTTVRTAILDQRAALDALLTQLDGA